MLRTKLGAAEEQVHVARESVSGAQMRLDSTVISAPPVAWYRAEAPPRDEIISPI